MAHYRLSCQRLSKVQELVRGGRCWIKLSGANRTSVQGQPYRDTTPFAQALIEVDPTRMLWGSDWPHVWFDGPMPNDGDLVDLVPLMAPDDALTRKLLIQNPARLYDFG